MHAFLKGIKTLSEKETAPWGISTWLTQCICYNDNRYGTYTFISRRMRFLYMMVDSHQKRESWRKLTIFGTWDSVRFKNGLVSKPVFEGGSKLNYFGRYLLSLVLYGTRDIFRKYSCVSRSTNERCCIEKSPNRNPGI